MRHWCVCRDTPGVSRGSGVPFVEKSVLPHPVSFLSTPPPKTTSRTGPYRGRGLEGRSRSSD